MPHIIVIAGANGAGKSTLAPFLLRDVLGVLEFVNADTIAAGLSAFAPENSAFEAGKIMIARLKELSRQRKDLAFETTLASRFYANWIRQRQNDGYKFHLVFLRLQSPELAIERVRARVRLGGHIIAEDVIRRRYLKGLINFFSLYQPLADSWQFYDVSTATPERIAFGDKIAGEKVFNQTLWQQIK